jgi:hypothetical protein
MPIAKKGGGHQAFAMPGRFRQHTAPAAIPGFRGALGLVMADAVLVRNEDHRRWADVVQR